MQPMFLTTFCICLPVILNSAMLNCLENLRLMHLFFDKNLFYQACLQIIKFLCENITDEGSIFVTVNRTKETIYIEFKSNGQKFR